MEEIDGIVLMFWWVGRLMFIWSVALVMQERCLIEGEFCGWGILMGGDVDGRVVQEAEAVPL